MRPRLHVWTPALVLLVASIAAPVQADSPDAACSGKPCRLAVCVDAHNISATVQCLYHEIVHAQPCVIPMAEATVPLDQLVSHVGSTVIVTLPLSIAIDGTNTSSMKATGPQVGVFVRCSDD